MAKFSFPDDDEHSIDLTVKDFSGCRGFKTHKVGGYEFTLSTDPSGQDTGAVSGTRGTMKFKVTVTAKATGNLQGTPPAQLTFEFSRAATGQTGTAVALRVAGSSPPRYEFEWNVTQEKGRRQIKVAGYKSNTAFFKVDKRKQIVKVAKSWVGAAQPALGSATANCNDLSAIVYNHLGLPLSGSTRAEYDQATVICSGEGCLLFYNIVEGPEDGPYVARSPWQTAHVAIQVGNQRININSATGGPNTVTQEAKDAGVNTLPAWYDPDIHSRSTVNLDED